MPLILKCLFTLVIFFPSVCFACPPGTRPATTAEYHSHACEDGSPVTHFGAPFYGWCCPIGESQGGDGERPGHGDEPQDEENEKPEEGNKPEEEKPEEPEVPHECSLDMQWAKEFSSPERNEQGQAVVERGLSDLNGVAITWSEFEQLVERITQGSLQMIEEFKYQDKVCASGLDSYDQSLSEILSSIPEEMSPIQGSSSGVPVSVSEYERGMRAALEDCLNNAMAGMDAQLNQHGLVCPEPPCVYTDELCLTGIRFRVFQEATVNDRYRDTYVQAFCRVSYKAACSAAAQ